MLENGDEVYYVNAISAEVTTEKGDSGATLKARYWPPIGARISLGRGIVTIMGLRFTVLSSGSTGNATVVATDTATVLVDVGLSGKKIEELMRERDVAGEHVDAIFVTHEHSDHIKGLGAFARK